MADFPPLSVVIPFVARHPGRSRQNRPAHRFGSYQGYYHAVTGSPVAGAGEQARAVERVADRDHHPAHGILGDVEAVAEVVSRPQMVEDVPARCIERGVGLGRGSQFPPHRAAPQLYILGSALSGVRMLSAVKDVSWAPTAPGTKR